MIPPTSIDGTDITGATIDGTDVQEITVDGDTVFSAVTTPVAFSDMIAWYPMEANIPGGDEFSDATALFSGAADSTPYDLVDDGAVYEASEGVTDIIEGASSGAFENVNGGQYLTSSVPLSIPITISFWYKRISEIYPFGTNPDTDFLYYAATLGLWRFDNASDIGPGGSSLNQFEFVALSIDASGNAIALKNRNATDTGQVNAIGGEVELLNVGDGRTRNDMRGYIDDFRVYNTNLTIPQLQQIYDNTEP